MFCQISPHHLNEESIIAMSLFKKMYHLLRKYYVSTDFSLVSGETLIINVIVAVFGYNIKRFDCLEISLKSDMIV